MSNAVPGCITLYATLNRDAFDDADRRTSGHDARETKTRPAQQGAVLLFRTLLSTRHHKHRDVQQLNWVWRVAGRHHGLDNQQSARGSHSCAAITKNNGAFLVGPIMYDVGQQVGVATLWNAFEKVYRLQPATLLQTARLDQRLRLAQHVRQFGQHAANAGIAQKNGSYKIASAADDVDHGVEA